MLVKVMLELFIGLLNPIFLIPLVVVVVLYIKKNKEYKASAYYQITKVPYLKARRDLGKWGEYLTYKYLKKFENDGAKFLFNVYIPKENGETTEIDVLMISKKGIFVFESKNYSGWIFGSEQQKNWYQTLPAGRGRSHKEHFYNPIMQNRSHIKHLKALIGEQTAMHSIIVFSERCTLKSVSVKSTDIRVVNRNEVVYAVSEVFRRTPNDLLLESEIMELYDKLYPYTQNSEDVKKQHIANIQNNLAAKSSLVVEETDVIKHIEIEDKTIADESLSELSTDVSEKTDVIQKEIDKEQITKVDIIDLAETDIKAVDESRCPRCGGKLILRTARKGANAGHQFWGCDNFPKCRYIKAIDDMNK